MDPNGVSQPSFEVPTPPAPMEQAPLPPVATPEQLTQQSELPHQGGPVPSPAAVPSLPAMPAAPLAPLPQAAATSQHTAHLAAEDADLIEKAWVEKAKQIVHQTRLDPHLQSDELSKVKADYIRKRYNKELKAKEG